MFNLFLFSTDRKIIRLADQGGISGFVVDWENRGKTQRQQGYDTQISSDSYEDLRKVRKITDKNIICRINNVPELIDEEIEKAISFGANEILVPMIRSTKEVAGLLDTINQRCNLALMLETREAVSQVNNLASFPISRIFLGLQDLSIDFGYANIFKPLCDNTVDRIRSKIAAPFGFGGATLPHKGYPLPCKLLLSELVRLNCDFTFLRRSFLRDVLIDEIPEAIQSIQEYFDTIKTYSHERLEENRTLFIGKIKESDKYFAKINNQTN